MFNKFQYMKRIIIAMILIIIIIIVAYLFQYCSLIKSIPDVDRYTEELQIPEWQNYKLYRDKYDETTKSFLFENKKRISDSIYGFYNEITFDNKVALYITIYGEDQKQCKNVRYGIYEDKKLQHPVEETLFIDWGDESYAEAELGKARKINEIEDGKSFLDPGTYYIGLFTTNPKDDFKVEIESWYGVIKAEHNLNENQEYQFFITDDEEDIYLKLNSNDNTRIHIECYIDGIMQLCNSQKKPVSNAVKLGFGNYSAVFDVNKNDVYYLKLGQVKSTEMNLPVTIKYSGNPIK